MSRKQWRKGNTQMLNILWHYAASQAILLLLDTPTESFVPDQNNSSYYVVGQATDNNSIECDQQQPGTLRRAVQQQRTRTIEELPTTALGKTTNCNIGFESFNLRWLELKTP